MSTDLLPKVELWQLSEHVAQAIREIVREALEEHGDRLRSRAGGMRAAAAAAYIGVSRSKFYELLRTEPYLQASSFRAGTARMWRKDDLDAWMQAQVEPKQPNSSGGE